MKQRKMDYHLHTNHSMDGRQSMEELCQAMVAQGVDEICLTEHIEPGHPESSSDKPPVWKDWWADIEACREKYPQLIIRAGLEIGDNPLIPDKVRAIVDSQPLDFRLLSLHLVDNMDPYRQSYFLGKNRREAYRGYARAKADSVCSWTDFDSVAHIGYVAKFSPYEREEKPLYYEDAPEEFDRLLRHVIALDKCIEVNTSGFDMTEDPFPHSSIIRRYIELGGTKFTFGSDSHTVGRDYKNIERAKELVKSLGGKYQASFENRRRTLWEL